MSYWRTLKEWNTFWYTLVWVLLCFPGLRTVGDFVGCLHRGEYAGAAGVLMAVILWLVVFYFVVGGLRHFFKLYNSPEK